MAEVEKWTKHFGGAEAVTKELGDTFILSSPSQHWALALGLTHIPYRGILSAAAQTKT